MSIDIPKFDSHPIAAHQERIAELESRWDEALERIKSELYPETPIDDKPAPSALAHESQANFRRTPGAQLLIGVAGPGAAGKGTLGGYLSNELGFSKVINTTTRSRREGETDGADYFFVDRREFSTRQNLGHFALTLERIGRGMYGISHEEIAKKLAESRAGCVIEENPANLMELFSNIENSDAQTVLLYILPEHPIVKNSLHRLEQRQSEESDPAKRAVTPEIFESTLGDRQIDEFLALAELPQHPNITPVFVINANLEDTKIKLATMFGDNDDTAPSQPRT